MKAEMMKRVGDAVIHEIGDGYEVSFHKIVKNNNFVRLAIVIRRTGDTVCPVIYIDELLKKINSGCKSVQSAAMEIADMYRNVELQGFSNSVIELSKNSILENVVYQIVNTKLNVNRLSNIPHKELFDLSAVYRVVVNDDDGGTNTIEVDYNLCSTYAISNDELEFYARRNTKEKGFCIMTMQEIMAEMMGAPVETIQEECPPMYIFTNAEKVNGASVMLYGEYFGELSAKLRSDLYIMPSSIHEVIAVPADGLNPDDLRRMVAEVNARAVSSEEILGESVYKYNLETGMLEIV